MRNFLNSAAALSCLGVGISVGASANAQEEVGGQEREKAGATVTPGSPVSVFGTQGQIAISSEAGATFERTSISGVDGSTSSFQVRPGVDYFVIRALSVGVFVGLDRESSPGGSTTTFGIGPRVGYDVAFSDIFSLWPRAGLSFNHSSLKIDGSDLVPDADTSNDAIAINLFAPFLYHTHRFFAGVGPALDADLSGDTKATTLAVRVTLGGWVF
jgi:hypothetical protein